MSYEDIICDANNLYKAYKASIKGSQWKESSQKFELHYLRNIAKLQDDLRNRTYKSSPTHEFVLHERGRERLITTNKIRDRIVRHVLVDEILGPEIRKKVIYTNCASQKGRGISMQQDHFEQDLHEYYRRYRTNEGYILFGDYRKFYDNIIHEYAKEEFLELVDHDEYVDWLLTEIFSSFEIDVSYMDDDEFAVCLATVFNKIEYRKLPSDLLTGDKMMKKSVNIGDQLSQQVGIYYPNTIDQYIKTVKAMPFYGRYSDDWYVIYPDKAILEDLLTDICEIAESRGMHVNVKKTRIVKISATYKFLQTKYSLTDSGKVIKRINPKKVSKERRKLKKLRTKLDYREIPYENIEDSFKGWMGSQYKNMSKQQRQNMIELYEELFNKEICIVNRKMLIIDRDAGDQQD